MEPRVKVQVSIKGNCPHVLTTTGTGCISPFIGPGLSQSLTVLAAIVKEKLEADKLPVEIQGNGFDCSS